MKNNKPYRTATLPPAAAAIIANVPSAHLGDVFIYRGMCDASAAASLDADTFVVANDERNTLKVYRRGEQTPIASVDLSDFLGTKKNKESDLEGAATIGKRIYWISSHGRNKNGEVQERRYRFFATEIREQAPRVAPVGQPYSRLLDDMAAAPELKEYRFAEAAARMPEAEGAMNIEGLAATLDGQLLIGMRNPAPEGMALLVPLLNPEQVIEGEPARFGRPIELDLDGRAIRSIELVGLAYMIVAGPPGNKGEFGLYRWSGDPNDPPEHLSHVDFRDARPEALFTIPGTRRVQILSDDGGASCRELDEADQTFQSVTIKL